MNPPEFEVGRQYELVDIQKIEDTSVKLTKLEKQVATLELANKELTSKLLKENQQNALLTVECETLCAINEFLLNDFFSLKRDYQTLKSKYNELNPQRTKIK